MQTLKRDDFPAELFWKQNDACSGFSVSDSKDCEWRIGEMKLQSYTPTECTDSTFDYCDKLVAYVRLDVHK